MSDNLRPLGSLALAAAAVYLVYKATRVAEGTVKAIGSAQEAITSGLYSLFGPDEREFGDWLYFTVSFPDGQKHAIGRSLVDNTGKFQYQNVWYRILDDAQGTHHAFPL